MTKSMARALEAVRRLPPDQQEELAQAIMEVAELDEGEPIRLTAEEREAVRLGREAYRRGEIATDEEVQAVLSRYPR